MLIEEKQVVNPFGETTIVGYCNLKNVGKLKLKNTVTGTFSIYLKCGTTGSVSVDSNKRVISSEWSRYIFYDVPIDGEVEFGVGEYYLYDAKFESGSKVTSYTPSPEDDPIMYDNVIYDTSGYGNNGSVADSTCPTWSDNSPRYKGCYHFEKKHYLTIQSPFGASDVSEFSINLWIRQISGGAYSTFLTSGGYGGSGLWLAMNTEGSGQWAYKGGISPNYARGDTNLSLNTWYMFTYVFKDGKVTWYRDGVNKGSTTYSKSTSPFASTIILGDNFTGTSWDTNFIGDISDFRIYSTALSDADILDLYQTSASVDNNGNLLLTGEVIEE